MSAWWPVLQQRLVALIPTIVPDFTDGHPWLVFDGPAAGEESGKQRYILVGASTEGEAGTFDNEDDPADTLRVEQGSVVVELNSWTGDKASSTRRAECWAVVSALAEQVKQDMTLGVLPKVSTTSLSAEVITPANGKSCRLVLSLNYTIRSA